MTEATAIPDIRPAKYVGARVERVEDPTFLTGRARYLDDIELPGMLHAAFVRSPYAHARITSIDVSKAAALEGVELVLTGADLQKLTDEIPSGLPRDEVVPSKRWALSVDKVRHVGDPVAIVVAESRYIAEDAVDLVEIEWEPLEVVVDPEKAMEPGAPLIDEALESNNIAHIVDSAGDVEDAFSGKYRIFSKRFYHGRSTGSPMEGRGVIADWEHTTGRMNVWNSTQMPYLLRTLLAPVLRLPEGKLNVVTAAVGGGFGLKCHLFSEDVAVPAASRVLGRPVKWVEDRYENLATGVHSKACVCDVEVAVEEDGTFVGFRGRFVADGGAYSVVPYTPLIDSLLAGWSLPGIYKVRNVAYEVEAPLTNKSQLGAIRGVGFTTGHTAREAVIEEVARGLGIDPVELRLKNCIGPEPYTTPFGAEYDGGSYAQSLERARDMIGYTDFRERQERLRKEGRYLGIGFSPYVEPTGLHTDSAKASGFVINFFDSATVTMEPDGSVVVRTGLHSHGQGHATSLAQVAADDLGVRIEDVRVVFGDTESGAYGMGTYASRSAVIGTGTINLAAGEVRGKLLQLAGELLEASADDIELYDNKAFIKGSPQKSISIPEVAAFAYFGGTDRPESMEEPALTATRTYEAPQTYANGTVALIVEVDTRTGMVNVESLVAVEDCGIMLNPLIVDGQIAGAVAQGIGAGLLEDLVYNEDGQFLSGNFADYLLPSTMDVPSMEIEHIETRSAVTLGGVKGTGEAGMIALPAAIVNAVSDALSPFGVRIDRTPVSPDYIRSILREQEQSAPA